MGKQSRNEINTLPPTNAKMEEWKDFYLKKCVPKLNQNGFLLERKNIERLVDLGYQCELITEEERQAVLKPKITQLEIDYYTLMTAAGEKVEDPRKLNK